MGTQDFRSLQEAYMEVVENQQQLDETGKNDARIRDNIRRFKGSKVEYTPPRNWDPEANRGQGATVSAKQAEKRRRKALRQEEVDLYDIILSHLLDEGYAETFEAAEAIMVNMSEDWRENIMEISQKTATNAYATSSTAEFEGQDSPRDVKRTDNLRKHIKRKFGNKAAKHADRAAHSMTFGRKGAGGMPPKP